MTRYFDAQFMYNFRPDRGQTVERPIQGVERPIYGVERPI